MFIFVCILVIFPEKISQILYVEQNYVFGKQTGYLTMNFANIILNKYVIQSWQQR